MNIELKQAAQRALLALRNSQPHPSNPFIGLTDKDFIDHEETIRQLRNALQQAEAKTDEPVAWVVMNGLSKYQVCGAKAPADALCSEMQKRHDLSGSLAAFHVQPLYTHSAPGVSDDSKRLNYLQDRGATIDLIPGVAGFYPMQFRVGGLHSSANIDVRAAIDATMLAARERP